MARKRTELTPDQTARIEAGIRRGETAEQIATALGGIVSARTIGRRMQERRGPVAPPRPSAAQRAPEVTSPPSALELPTTPDDIPEGASLPELQDLLRRCKTALSAAEGEDNLPLVGQMIRVAASLAETIRKATPPAAPDPNANPDMLAAKERARAEWHRLVDMVVTS